MAENNITNISGQAPYFDPRAGTAKKNDSSAQTAENAIREKTSEVAAQSLEVGMQPLKDLQQQPADHFKGRGSISLPLKATSVAETITAKFQKTLSTPAINGERKADLDVQKASSNDISDHPANSDTIQLKEIPNDEADLGFSLANLTAEERLALAMLDDEEDVLLEEEDVVIDEESDVNNEEKVLINIKADVKVQTAAAIAENTSFKKTKEADSEINKNFAQTIDNTEPIAQAKINKVSINDKEVALLASKLSQIISDSEEPNTYIEVERSDGSFKTLAGDLSKEDLANQIRENRPQNGIVYTVNSVTGERKAHRIGNYSKEVWAQATSLAITNYNQRMQATAALQAQNMGGKPEEVGHGGGHHTSVHTPPPPLSATRPNVDRTDKYADKAGDNAAVIRQESIKTENLTKERKIEDRIKHEEKAIAILMAKLEKFIKADRNKEENLKAALNGDQIKNASLLDLITVKGTVTKIAEMPHTKETLKEVIKIVVKVVNEVEKTVSMKPSGANGVNINHLQRKLMSQAYELVVTLKAAVGVNTVSGGGNAPNTEDSENAVAS